MFFHIIDLPRLWLKSSLVHRRQTTDLWTTPPWLNWWGWSRIRLHVALSVTQRRSLIICFYCVTWSIQSRVPSNRRFHSERYSALVSVRNRLFSLERGGDVWKCPKVLSMGNPIIQLMINCSKNMLIVCLIDCSNEFWLIVKKWMKGLEMNFINLLLKNKYYQQIPRFCRFYNWVLKI